MAFLYVIFMSHAPNLANVDDLYVRLVLLGFLASECVLSGWQGRHVGDSFVQFCFPPKCAFGLLLLMQVILEN